LSVVSCQFVGAIANRPLLLVVMKNNNKKGEDYEKN